MIEADLPVQRPVEVILEDVEGLVVLIVEHRLRHQPVQLGVVADKTAGEGALMGGAGADVRQRSDLLRLVRQRRAVPRRGRGRSAGMVAPGDEAALEGAQCVRS